MIFSSSTRKANLTDLLAWFNTIATPPDVRPNVPIFSVEPNATRGIPIVS